MKKLLYILPLAALLFGCAEEFKTGDTVLEAGDKPTITAYPTDQIEINNQNIEAGTFDVSFTPGTYTTAVGIVNEIQLATTAEFTDAVVLGSATLGNEVDEVSLDMTTTFTMRQLNGALTTLGLTPNESAEIKLRVVTKAQISGAVIAGSNPMYSDAVTLSVVPFEPQAAYIWATGEFYGWANNNDENQPTLCSRLDNGIYIGYFNFPSVGSPFLLLPVPGSWDSKWASGGEGVLLVNDGSDIPSAFEGYTKVTANLTALTIAQEAYSWGIIGDATPTGWDSDTDMTWNHNELRWELELDLVPGNFKIRLNNGWDINWGISDGVPTKGGGDIPITEAGHYLITLDEEIPELTFTIVTP